MSDEEEDWTPFEEPKKPVGCPPLFTEDRANRVLEAVRRGLTYKQAAAYAGISYSTLNRWRIEGRKRAESGNGDEGSEICKFWKALQEANGEAAFRLVGRVDAAAEAGDWKAATWILERRFPDQWGKERGIELDAEDIAFPTFG